jgi:NAD(P)-dependent dehydrogenase (short-subunit alcohol dehydrogenase family)
MKNHPISDLYSDLKGKTVLITGASSGIGESAARFLSSFGMRLILAARRIDKLETIAKEIGNAVAIEMDISDKESITRAIAKLESQGERIDILINNAGINKAMKFISNDRDRLEENIKTNLFGTWYLTRIVAKHMVHYKIHGSIINIGSYAHRTPESFFVPYTTSKAALEHMTRALVGELSSYKIRINCIDCGIVKTDLAGYLKDPSIEKLFNDRIIPLGFVAEPKHLHPLIAYLASNQASSYMTGAAIPIDGGTSVAKLPKDSELIGEYLINTGKKMAKSEATQDDIKVTKLETPKEITRKQTFVDFIKYSNPKNIRPKL